MRKSSNLLKFTLPNKKNLSPSSNKIYLHGNNNLSEKDIRWVRSNSTVLVVMWDSLKIMLGLV